jgi:hypothetical protein
MNPVETTTTKLVAECWTCRYRELWCLERIDRITPMPLYANSLWNEADSHRRLGHEVRRTLVKKRDIL